MDRNPTQSQINDLILRCINKVKDLLEDADFLLSSDTSGEHALGLFMYAVEEYGKANLLKGYLQNESPIPGWIFGHRRSPTPDGLTPHDIKLREGFRNLPKDCRQLAQGLRIVYNNNSKYQTFRGRGSAISVPPLTPGIFLDVTHGTLIPFDFKTACFYIDWDVKNNKSHLPIMVEKGQLKENIRKAKETVKKFF